MVQIQLEGGSLNDEVQCNMNQHVNYEKTNIFYRLEEDVGGKETH